MARFKVFNEKLDIVYRPQSCQRACILSIDYIYLHLKILLSFHAHFYV